MMRSTEPEHWPALPPQWRRTVTDVFAPAVTSNLAEPLNVVSPSTDVAVSVMVYPLPAGMPPIVPLTAGEPLVSMVPALVKLLPEIVYATVFSVTPGAAVRLSPIEPTCSVSTWLPWSLEQLASGPPTASANQMRGILP